MRELIYNHCLIHQCDGSLLNHHLCEHHQALRNGTVVSATLAEHLCSISHHLYTAMCKDKKKGGVYKEERKSSQRGSKFITYDPCVQTKKMYVRLLYFWFL